MRDKHYKPVNNLRKDIEVCLNGAGLPLCEDLKDLLQWLASRNDMAR
jgi:hypothetical protein